MKKLIWNIYNVYIWSVFRFLLFCCVGIIIKDIYEVMRKNDYFGEKFFVIIKDYGYYLKSKDREMD